MASIKAPPTSSSRLWLARPDGPEICSKQIVRQAMLIRIVRIKGSVDEVDERGGTCTQICHAMRHPPRDEEKPGISGAEGEPYGSLVGGRSLAHVEQPDEQSLQGWHEPEIVLVVVQVPGLDRPRFHKRIADLRRPISRHACQRSIAAEPRNLAEVTTLVAEDF